MKIIPVGDRDGLAEFVEFPWTVYRGDPLWVPPLREQVFYELSGRNAFARYGRIRPFLCEADGRIAGRIAASINPRLVDANGAVFGQLGYFECVNEPAIASALIDAGLDWLKAQGITQVLGPMNGGAIRPHRFLTRGFDRAPYLFEPRNPPYYPTLFERSGFVPVSRWYGYELTRQQAEDHWRRLDRVLERRPSPFQPQELMTGQSPDTLVRVHRLMDRCWAGHVGYAPLDFDEFAEVFAGLLAIMGPGHVVSLVREGEDGGFAFIYPDYADDVRALQGDATGWGRWLGASRPGRIVLSTAALTPDARRSSTASAIMAWAFRRAVTDGFTDVVVSLVVEGFLAKVGDLTREYALYGRSLR